MSWFLDLLTDVSRQAAPGIQTAISDDLKRKRDLAGQVEAFKTLAPMQEEQAQRQERFKSGLQTERELAVAREKARLKDRESPLLSFLKQPQQVPADAANLPSYEVGSVQTQPETVSGVRYLQRALNLPETHEATVTMSDKGPSIRYAPPGRGRADTVGAGGLTNETIQAGLSLPQLPRDPKTWTAEDWAAATKQSQQLRQDRAVMVDARRLNEAKQRFPNDPVAAWNYYNELRGVSAGTEAWYRAAGPLESSPPTMLQRAGSIPEDLSAGESSASAVSPTGTPRSAGVSPVERRAYQSARGSALGDPIPTSERGRFAELYTLQDSINNVRKLTNNLAEPWFGPVRGGIVAPFSERITGNISDQEVQARRLMYDMSDMLLRARSGAQINEQEYQRLRRLLPTPDLPANVAKARLDDFERQLQQIVATRTELQRMPAGDLPRGQRGAAVPSTPTSSLKGQRTNKPDGTYEMNGQRFTVKGGVIQ